MDLVERIEEAAGYVRARCGERPSIGMVLGSGLGLVADAITPCCRMAYSEIPHFPVSRVSGHAGELVIGDLKGKHVLAMKGRVHYYEGFSMEEVTFPIRVMRALGVRTLILTNAAGSLKPSLNPGDLMVIVDHLNMMWVDPLRGPNDDRLGPRFPVAAKTYDHDLIRLAKRVAATQGINLKHGVYAATSGPCYETPAFISLLCHLGVDAVGMSTVPEALVANHAGMRTLAISCITDGGSEAGDISHAAVLRQAEKAGPRFASLIAGIVETLDE